MSARKILYIKPITDKLIELINSNSDLGFIKTVSSGDLKLLPAPSDFEQFMPALLVKPEDTFNNAASPNKSTNYTEYLFTIRYLKYFNVENMSGEELDISQDADLIGNTLLAGDFLFDKDANGKLLPYGKLYDEEGKLQGHILGYDLHHIHLNTTEEEIFKNLELPVAVAEFTYSVYFRSIHVK